METSDILWKIGGHVVFAESQSGAFRTVIPQSILRITHYAIPQIINIPWTTAHAGTSILYLFV